MFWLIILFAVSLFKDDMPFLEKFEKFIACPYAHMFIAGSCIHFVQSDLKVNRVFSVVDMALSVLYQFVMFERVQAFFFVFATVLTALCVYADKKHFKINKNAAFIVRMLCFVASLSYPMYLLHQNLGYIIMKALIDKGFGSELIIFVPMIVIGTVSYVIHIFVEKRFIHGLGLV